MPLKVIEGIIRVARKLKRVLKNEIVQTPTVTLELSNRQAGEVNWNKS
jgi:PBP1b-binding outer membrane lipoprotein LpoB